MDRPVWQVDDVIDISGSDARLRMRLFGGFEVSVAGRLVPEAAWGQRRASAIVKLLALEPTHRLHREQLMETLWPDLDLDAQSNNLRQMLHHARKHLVAAGMPNDSVLMRHGDVVVLAPVDTVWVDVHAFERSVAHAWRNLSPLSAHAALDIYAGDLLPTDLYEEWAEQRRTALRASYLALLARLGHLHVERDERSEAIRLFQRLIAAEPTEEAAHVALMRLYAATSQRPLALAQYERLVATLEREQDAEPEPQTRDLAAAIRAGIYQPAVPDPLPDQTDRDGGLPTGATNLPIPLSTLIGREREIAEAGQLLRTARLATLTGPGGIGKTRLAIAAAHAAGSDFPASVFFIDLAPIRDPALVVSTIAHVLGVRGSSDQSLIASVVSFLRDKRFLLVLDNFEHVTSAARSIAAILEQAASVKVLVTSRTRLKLRGEREYAVPPLAVAETHGATAEEIETSSPAVALFVARTRERRPDFALTAENAPAVAAICRRLDGLPLAIELAAARGAVLSPRAMVHRLARPLALLSGGGDDLPERQQTLRKTIDWSHDLLNASERALFRRLGVFLGGWTLDAAEAVSREGGDASDDVLDGLHSLIDKSLVTRHAQPDGELRFGMLETIREFALEQLGASEETVAARDRHAAHFIALAERAAPQLEGADQVAWHDRLTRDDGNFRAALDWLYERKCTELGLRLVWSLKLHWYVRGYLAEGYEQTIRFTTLAESAAFPILRGDALNAAGFLAREYGDYARADAASRESLALSHALNDRKRAADALANLGYVALQQGKLDDARDLLQRSLDTHRELGNQQGIADSLSFLALTAFRRDDLAAARHMNEESLAIWTALDDRQATVWARTRLAPVLLRQGAYAAAYGELMTSLRVSSDLDFRWGFSWSFDGFAQIALLHGAPHLAARLAAAAASAREGAGIWLSPLEQAENDHLLDQIRAVVGDAAVADAWAERERWTLDELIPAIERAIGDGDASDAARSGIA